MGFAPWASVGLRWPEAGGREWEGVFSLVDLGKHREETAAATHPLGPGGGVGGRGSGRGWV